ncbi:class I SAM-dependent methyltransferase [uncultured Algibacter sp.]|uniref:class I SAM-dependent methyltransferase n=1 Tax=uncultured Algibacter sp. TaxID=298659 RepID=UPI0030EF89BF|tara:strand:+ start:130 stop:915 length:786 start_codon:yes stop_codon:yes gene_type:complete
MKAKYDDIGISYNDTRSADPYIAERLLKNLNPKANGLYVDIGCGTGNYTNTFQEKGFNFIGIDPSEKMLEKAKQKNKHIDWILGKAENITLKTKSIDGIIGSLTIHHWGDLEKSFDELYRVLKPNGHLVIFTSTPKQMKGYWLNHYFPKMIEDSMLQMPSFDHVEKVMINSGFSKIKTELYNIKPNLKDLFLYCGKQNPKLYFNPAIRQGISSFSSLANKNEVEIGLKKLEKDILNNGNQDIMDSYKNDLGDYLFIVGEKL